MECVSDGWKRCCYELEFDSNTLMIDIIIIILLHVIQADSQQIDIVPRESNAAEANVITCTVSAHEETCRVFLVDWT